MTFFNKALTSWCFSSKSCDFAMRLKYPLYTAKEELRKLKEDKVNLEHELENLQRSP